MRITIDINKVNNGAVIAVRIGEDHWSTEVVQSLCDYTITTHIERMVEKAYKETNNENAEIVKQAYEVANNANTETAKTTENVGASDHRTQAGTSYVYP
jgi:hypothetical protein